MKRSRNISEVAYSGSGSESDSLIDSSRSQSTSGKNCGEKRRKIDTEDSKAKPSLSRMTCSQKRALTKKAIRFFRALTISSSAFPSRTDLEQTVTDSWEHAQSKAKVRMKIDAEATSVVRTSLFQLLHSCRASGSIRN